MKTNLNEGGPGSGVKYRNTVDIDMPRSEYISVGTRKGLLQNADFEEHEVPVDAITKVGQRTYVPHKLDNMLGKKEVITARPIDVLWVPGDGYHIVDGHHRFLAAQKLGIQNLMARVYRKSEKTMPGYGEREEEGVYEAVACMESGDIDSCYEALVDLFSPKEVGAPEVSPQTHYSMGDKIALAKALEGKLDTDGSIAWDSELGRSVLRFHQDGRIAELQDETGVYKDMHAVDKLNARF